MAISDHDQEADPKAAQQPSPVPEGDDPERHAFFSEEDDESYVVATGEPEPEEDEDAARAAAPEPGKQAEKGEEPAELEALDGEPAEATVRFKAIHEKYPKIFKEFPELRPSLGKYIQYDRLFNLGGLDEAQQSRDQAEVMNVISQQVQNGDITPFLGAVQQKAPDSFKALTRKFVTESLPQMDQETYREVMTEGLLDLLKEHWHGDNRQDPLEIAIEYIADSFLGGKERLKKQPEDPSVVAMRQQLEQQMQSARQQALDRGMQYIARESDNLLAQHSLLILQEAGITEPSPELSNYVSVRIRELLGNGNTNSGVRYTAELQRLNRLAIQHGSYTPSLSSSILRVYLERVKALAPKVREELSRMIPRQQGQAASGIDMPVQGNHQLDSNRNSSQERDQFFMNA